MMDSQSVSSSLTIPTLPISVQLEDVQLSRFLVCMEASGIPFRLLLNKADLVAEEELQAQVQKVRLAVGCVEMPVQPLPLLNKADVVTEEELGAEGEVGGGVCGGGT